MKVEGAYIPANTYVCFVRHTGVFTRIKLSSGGAQVGATLYLVTESNTNNLVTFTFSNPDGSLILPKNSLYIDYDSFETFGYKITFAAQSDIADVKIGMLVNGGEYPIGTVVTHVGSNAKVVVSNLPLFGENTFSRILIGFMCHPKSSIAFQKSQVYVCLSPCLTSCLTQA